MADEASNLPSPFDVRTIKQLVAMMSQHDLSEIDLHAGDRRIRLRRGGGPASAAPRDTSGQAPAPAASAPAPVPAAGGSEPAKPAKLLQEIKSPTPGTFYTAANPKSDAFVKVGSRVTPTTVVCIIEAMKIFNEITADCTGVVTEILAENQQPVEYGQVLFRVDPTA